MPVKKYICRICGVRDIDPDILEENKDYIRHGNWCVHKSCYDLREKKRKGISLQDNETDDFWRNSTYDFLKVDLKMEMNNGLFFKQWYNYVNSKKKKYTPKGIYFALKYFYEIKKGSIDKANGGIGIVDYIYEESRLYWYEREEKTHGVIAEIEEQLRQKENRKTKVVRRKEIKPNKKKINLSMIAEMEDEE